MIKSKWASIVVAVFVVTTWSRVASAEDLLKATTMLPRPVVYTKDFAKWVNSVNKRGKGILQIKILGGPEAIPTFQQAEAVRKGIVDMIWGPATYYLGAVPAVNALVGSNMTPSETRKSGGIALLNKIYQKRLNAYYLGRTHFIRLHIYTTKRPKIAKSGMVDLSGFRLRGTPSYRKFFVDLGSTFVNMAAPEVYTALERGTINGVGWPLVGISDFSWDKHLKYRIDPGFFSSDVSTIVNLDKWKKLSQRAREFLQREAIAYESDSYNRFVRLSKEADKRMRAKGMTVITLRAAAARRFRKEASDVAWQRLKEKDPKHYKALRAKFYAE